MARRVLVVDDEPYVREFICMVLAQNGYETVEANDGIEALELAQRHECHLVICDFTMPGMNGFELVSRLKDRRYPANYLLVSGNAGESDTGDLPFLAKPFTPGELMYAVETLKAHSPV
jgi:CheY-like chemotaxis protein